MLKGKTVVLGVTGSIAAYKMANVASMLIKMHADVHVIMTQNACQFITPVTFETLTGNKCMVDTFDRNFQFHVAHVSIAKKADVVLIAPASANVIGKLANGIADDMLTTTVMACTCKIIVAPAMNTNMYHNPILQDNLKKLAGYGYEIIKELKERSQNVFQFKEGTLYPVLHKMENLGYVKSYRAQAENGKERKYYRITGAGKAQLAEEKKQWEVFSTSVERVIGARGFA